MKQRFSEERIINFFREVVRDLSSRTCVDDTVFQKPATLPVAR